MMKKLLRAACIGFGLLAGSFGLADAGLSFFTGPAGTNPTPDFPPGIGTLNSMINTINTFVGLSNPNASIGQLPLNGRVYSQLGPTTALANAQGGVTIATYSIPSGSLGIAGNTIHIRAWFHGNSSTDSRSWACGWGTAIVTETIKQDSGSAGWCDLVITNGATANTQMVSGFLSVGTTPNVATLSGTTSDSATTASATNAYFEVSNPTTAGDATLDYFEVDYSN